MTRRVERAAEVAGIRMRIARNLTLIDTIVDEQPDAMDLGTWRGIDNRVGGVLLLVEDYARRARARREARDGG